MTKKKLINLRVTEGEDAILVAYAKSMGQTKTDIVRALIRSLEKKIRAAQQQTR